MRKIRVITHSKNSREEPYTIFGFSVPKEIAYEFKDVKFYIKTTKDSIIFASGADIPFGKRKFSDVIA